MELLESVSGELSLLSVREKIEALEDEWKKYPQVDVPMKDCFSGGIYLREILIPAGTLLTGKIYLDDHFDIMVAGDVTVSSDDGVKRLTGFNVFPSKQGKKRAGYAHKDTHWITICKSQAKSNHLDNITVDSFAEFDDKINKRKNYISESEIKKVFTSQKSHRGSDYKAFRSGYLLGSGKLSKIEADREDYKKVLSEFGFTEELARSQSENESDQISCAGDVIVKTSEIEGQGLFADKLFRKGELIMIARVGDKRTKAGRYANHSINPNAVMVESGTSINLVALKDIDYSEITIDYRMALELQVERVA